MTNDSTPHPESTTRWVREPSPDQFREGEWRVYVGSDDDWFRLVEAGLVQTFVGEAPHPEGESKDGGLRLAIQCGHLQAKAGFERPDDRVFQCPSCSSPGFNTGWGYCAFECGAEMLNGEEGEWSTECPALSRAQGDRT